jgi:hypothetical protein
VTLLLCRRSFVLDNNLAIVFRIAANIEHPQHFPIARMNDSSEEELDLPPAGSTSGAV